MKFFTVGIALIAGFLFPIPTWPAALPYGAASCKVSRIYDIFKAEKPRIYYYALYPLTGKGAVIGHGKNIEKENLQRHYRHYLPKSDQMPSVPKGWPQLIPGCTYSDMEETVEGSKDPWFEEP